MRLFYIFLMLLTFVSCGKDEREKNYPRVLTSGYDNGSYIEASSENISSSPIYILDVNPQASQNYLKYYLVKVYGSDGQNYNSYKLSETVTFCFDLTVNSFEFWDNDLRKVMCQVKRNDDNKYYRIVKGYVKGEKNSTGSWDISFKIKYKADRKRAKETAISSWD